VLEFENTIRIDRPIAEVFAFPSDFENIPKWSYYVLEVRPKNRAGLLRWKECRHQNGNLS